MDTNLSQPSSAIDLDGLYAGEHHPLNSANRPTIAKQVAALNSCSRRSSIAREVGRAFTAAYWADRLTLKLWKEDVAGEKVLRGELQSDPAGPLPGGLDQDMGLTVVWSGLAAKVLVEFDEWTVNRFNVIETVDLEGPDFSDADRAQLAEVPEGYWPVSAAFHELQHDRNELVRITDELELCLGEQVSAEATFDADAGWRLLPRT